MNKRRSVILLVIISIAIFLASLVNGFSVSSDYGPNSYIKIPPGETADIQFILEPAPSEGSLVIRTEIVEGGEIFSIIDPDLEYNANLGESALVNTRISINKTAKIGEEYSVIIKFSDITLSKNEGSVSFKGSSTINLKVLVAQPELKEGKGTGILFIFGFFLLIAIIAVILIIWFVIKNRR